MTFLEWQAFIDSTYEQKGSRRAAKWLRALLYTLRSYIKAHPPEVDNDEVAYECVRQECEEVFVIVAGPDGTLSKAELLAAHGGEPALAPSHRPPWSPNPSYEADIVITGTLDR